MYEYSVVITIDQLPRITVSLNGKTVSVVNSNTFDNQVVPITTVTIPPVDPKYILKYPTCGNFVKDSSLSFNVYNLQAHELAIVSNLNSSYNLVTNIYTSHIPRISELPSIIKNSQSKSDDGINTQPLLVSSLPKTDMEYTLNIPYVPGSDNEDLLIVTPPAPDFSLRTFWLSSLDNMAHSESASSVTDLLSRYCDATGNPLTGTDNLLVQSDLSKSHVVFKNPLDIFHMMSMWPLPIDNTDVISGLRVEYNSVSNPDLLTLFIKRDWREF